MPFPPIEDAPRSMTRRNYLVERNRLRTKAYEPTRKEHEAEDLRIATKRQEERHKMLDSWKSQTAYNCDSSRPLPGGGPRSQRMKEAASLKNPNYYKILREEEATLKAERKAYYKADIAQQLKDRKEYLDKCRADEKAYNDALVEGNCERARIMAERERQEKEATKEYMDRMRETNMRELHEKRAKTKEREDFELTLLRTVQQAHQHKAERDEARAKDMKRLMKMENEEYHRTLIKKEEENKARDEAELKAVLEYNAAVAEHERRENQLKRDQFKFEFEATIEKEKEFRRLHDYDEPLESIRKRNEAAAASHVLILREEKLRDRDRRREYRKDLMRQIGEKEEWYMTHLDGV